LTEKLFSLRPPPSRHLADVFDAYFLCPSVFSNWTLGFFEAGRLRLCARTFEAAWEENANPSGQDTSRAALVEELKAPPFPVAGPTHGLLKDPVEFSVTTFAIRLAHFLTGNNLMESASERRGIPSAVRGPPPQKNFFVLFSF